MAATTVENVPAGHGKHVKLVDAPYAEEYVPAGQFKQAIYAAPTSVENVPAGHATQTDAEEAPLLVEYEPAGQN